MIKKILKTLLVAVGIIILTAMLSIIINIGIYIFPVIFIIGVVAIIIYMAYEFVEIFWNTDNKY